MSTSFVLLIRSIALLYSLKSTSEVLPFDLYISLSLSLSTLLSKFYISVFFSSVNSLYISFCLKIAKPSSESNLAFFIDLLKSIF